MSALVPAVLSELVNNREPIGSLKLAIANNDPKYLECNGSVHLVDDYPVLAENLPTILSAANLLDVTNSRPLDSVSTTTLQWMVNGNRLFVQTGDFSSLKIIENGVEIASVSIPLTSAIQAYQVFGNNVIFCRASNRVGKSIDNGLTWFWTDAIYSNFSTSHLHGYFQGGAYDPTTDTFIFITKEAVHKIQGTTVSTYAGDNPGNLLRFSSTSITYSDVLFDSDTGNWYICGGAQTTSSVNSATHFVIGSSDGTATWQTLYQDRYQGYSSTRIFRNLIKYNNKFYAVSAYSTNIRLYVTTDFSDFSLTDLETTSGFQTDIGLFVVNNVVYLIGTSGRRIIEVLSLDNIDVPTWTKVSAGNKHTLGIRSDGTLWGWGYNEFGQLGTNNTASYTVPVQIGTDTDWIDCSAGSISSAAIKADGSLWTWGNNILGQLGLGDTTNRLVPTKVPGTTIWAQVAVASGYGGTSPATTLSLYTLAVDSAGQIHAAGRHPLTATGVMNTSLAAGTSSFQVIENSRVYTEVFPYCSTSTAAGGWVFAITSSNELYSWGYNGATGVLGRSSTAANLAIGKVGTTQTWKKISFSLVSAAAVTTNGELWTWGANANGQLGTGDTVSKLVPTRIGTDTDWASVSTLSSNAGVYATYALKTNSNLYLAGYRSYLTDLISISTATSTTSFILILSNSNLKTLLDRSYTTYDGGNSYGVIVLSALTNSNLYTTRGNNTYSGLGGTINASISPLYPESLVIGFNYATAEKKITLSSTLVVTPAVTNDLFYVSVSLVTTTGSGTSSSYIYTDNALTLYGSSYYYNVSAEILLKQATGYSSYKQNSGTFLYYPDYFNYSQPPNILEYNTLTNTAVISSNYTNGYTYSISGRYIYRSQDGAVWSRVGLNPFYRISSTTTELVEFNGIYYIASTGSGGLGRYSTDLHNWVYSSALLPSGFQYSRLTTNSSVLVATIFSSTTAYVLSSNLVRTTVTLPGTPIYIVGSDTEWMFTVSNGTVYRLLKSVPEVGDTWSLVSNISGVTNIGYKDGVWVATTAEQILYSIDRGTTWNVANIDSSDLGYISISAGSLTESNSVFVLACNNNSALVSSDGISWKRYIKPSEVTANSFTATTATPEAVVLRDETNLRSLLLTPGVPDETRFTLPVLRNEDNISYYVRAK